MTQGTKFHRGDTSPDHPGLVFFHYKRGVERWVAPEQLKEIKAKLNEDQRKRYKTPEYREYHKAHRQKPHVKESEKFVRSTPEYKAYISALKKQPKHRQKSKEFYAKYRKLPHVKSAASAYGKKHRQKPGVKERAAEYIRNRRRENARIRIASNIRRRINTFLRNKKEGSQSLLGCSFEFFTGYMAAMFTDGMSWRNYGRGEGCWNIDHIIPLSLFDLTKRDHQKLAFNYRNCRPSWEIENLCKQDALDLNLIRAHGLGEILHQLN